MTDDSPLQPRKDKGAFWVNQHRVAYPELVKDVIRISDIILQILDARALQETRNLELEALIKEYGKAVIFVINKADLVDARQLHANVRALRIHPYLLFSSKTQIGRARLRERIKIDVKRLYSTKKLAEHKQAHIGIIGYPNTGKSTLLNFFVGRNVARRSPQSGMTRGIQKIRFTKDILILDTPGVIPPDPSHEITRDAIGIKNYDSVKNPDLVVVTIMLQHPGILEEFYKIEASGDPEVLLEELGKQRNFILKKGVVDTDRTARLILKEWQTGIIRKKKK